MNCGSLIYNKTNKKVKCFWIVRIFWICSNVVWHCWCVSYYNLLFKMCCSDSVYFVCIYDPILKIWFNMFFKMSQKCEQISYEILFFNFVRELFWSCGPPPHPPPIPSVNVKVPFQGEKYDFVFLMIFMAFMKMY